MGSKSQRGGMRWFAGDYPSGQCFFLRDFAGRCHANRKAVFLAELLRIDIATKGINHGMDLVAANESMLTTVLALDPIYFTFEGSEALYLKAQRARQHGGDAAQQVEIKLQDEAGYDRTGRVDFTDNAIDPKSGTMRGRAVLASGATDGLQRQRGVGQRRYGG